MISVLRLSIFPKLFFSDLMLCICAYSIMELEFAILDSITFFHDSSSID